VPDVECPPVNAGDRQRAAVKRCHDSFACEPGLPGHLLTEQPAAADHEKIHAVTVVVSCSSDWCATGAAAGA
jgi:hypothetical protein